MSAPRRTLPAAALTLTLLAASLAAGASEPAAAALNPVGRAVRVHLTVGVPYRGPVAVVTDDDPGAVADHAALVSAWFADLLGRAPSSATVAPGSYWPSLLDRGTARDWVAAAVLRSAEGRRRLAVLAYQDHLGRTPSRGEAGYWAGLLGSGWSMAEVRVALLASDERLATAGGTLGGWVTALYQDLLGRSPGAGELAHWVAVADRFGRPAAARAVLLSGEGLRHLAGEAFAALVGRTPGGGEARHWAAVLAAAGEVAVRASLVSSGEYFAGLPSDYRATVTWPDGTSEAGMLRRRSDGTTMEVWADHRFQALGDRSIQVRVSRSGNPPVAVTSTAAVVLPTLERWAAAVLEEVTGSAPSARSRRHWARLARLAGSSRGHGARHGAAVALLLTGTGRSQAVAEAYQDHLGRSPGADETAYWASVMASRPVEHVRALLMGSGEFRSRAGGSDAGVVDRIWETVLGRTPSGSERDRAVARLAELGQSNLALEVLVSPEARRRLVRETVEEVLDRPAGSAEVSALAAKMVAGHLDERGLVAYLLASTELVLRFPPATGQLDGSS